ncbi:hypothetical protein [Oharaeibacter diazotrophicus]|uniref:Secreted protein n=1 Tax=Oharaeibacter diazotrophicus TaxID=1920512 RepID=A0A4R6R7R6_9HYPH|nr:hypothetical protein [Oharaeibacter diazotrophicus]TDP81949.1 hypothetical protein EDD54_4210 [Oharaeibacter diazotrophicus]BBE73581.1 hypothetical protein OHA_1_03195 [Pleomorphomonas sp. SM30]GLS75371.1 hypothetical protein GCM10007904_07060 [Oharaeibacter diazotrophicus]
MSRRLAPLALTAFATLAALAAPAVAAPSFDSVGVTATGGVVARTAGVVGVTKRALGRYEVRFARDMRACVAVATPKAFGDPFDVEGTDPAGRNPYFIQTAWTATSSGFPGVDFSKSVIVVLHKRDGTRVDKAFDLHVQCP